MVEPLTSGTKIKTEFRWWYRHYLPYLHGLQGLVGRRWVSQKKVFALGSEKTASQFEKPVCSSIGNAPGQLWVEQPERQADHLPPSRAVSMQKERRE
jgi:hypothetical protein